jgi:hypothetical protein
MFHQVFVDIGAGIAFIRVADDVFSMTGGLTARLPFEVEGESGAAASAQAGGFEFSREPVAISGQKSLEWGIISVNAMEWGR